VFTSWSLGTTTKRSAPIGNDAVFTFSSEKVFSEACLRKTSRTGKTSYSLQMMGAAFIHPDHKAVIPFPPK
jgi:hypothetical protein